MQTVLDLSLRAMSMVGRILKNYPFAEKQNFYKKIAYGLGELRTIRTLPNSDLGQFGLDSDLSCG